MTPALSEPLALYIHWPFCVSKCPYCDFNSHVREAVDQAGWLAALLADMAYEAALTPGRRLSSIFFGGGTPSLMPPAKVDALDVAQSEFDRVNIDLIYARPDQTAVEWERELARAIGLGADHMSLYQLTIEPGTRFATLVREGKFAPADDDDSATLYELTQAITVAAGLPAYEISNHAREGQQSRHNLTYWRYGDYIGIGPGAHGRRLKSGTQRHKKPENFLNGVGRNSHGIVSEEALDRETRATEALLMGLRLAEGIDLTYISSRTGVAVDKLLDSSAISNIKKLGLIGQIGQRVTITPQGMPLLDAILPHIVLVEPQAIA